MTSRPDERGTAPRKRSGDGTRWLGVGAGIALLLALAAVLLAWQRASEARRAAEDVGARVAAEMNRIEAEAQRIERDAAK